MGYTPNKLKYNSRERIVQEEGLKNGWQVLYKGWPDFLFYKRENGKISAFFVEVKRNYYNSHFTAKRKFLQKKTFDVKLSPEQEEMHKILKELGFEIKIIHKD